jgi:hypothetical protein
MKSLLLATLIFTGCGIEAVMCREDAFCFECKFVSDGGIISERRVDDDGNSLPIDKRLIEVKNAEASCYFYKCSKECGR